MSSRKLKTTQCKDNPLSMSEIDESSNYKTFLMQPESPPRVSLCYNRNTSFNTQSNIKQLIKPVLMENSTKESVNTKKSTRAEQDSCMGCYII